MRDEGAIGRGKPERAGFCFLPYSPTLLLTLIEGGKT